MYKIVASFTTSPSRIYRIEPVIEALLKQDYEVWKIEINVPDKYKNKEEYVIPDFLAPNPEGSGECLKYPKVWVVRTGRDIGPSSKVIPTLIRYKDDPEVFVVSVDDDHKYPPNIVSTLVKGLHLYGDNNIYGIGGLDVHLAPGMKVTMHGYDDTYQVATIEGVFGVLYNPRKVEDDIHSYYDTIMKCGECITSDDVTISNYFAMKKVPIMKLFFKNMNRRKLRSAFSSGLIIRDSDKDGNAIHMMPGGHGKRYFAACVFLKDQGLLHLKIKKGTKF
jgi:hypothetical protein